MAEAATRTVGFDHPLMQSRPVAKRAVILVSTDRGLCGGLNSNLFREAMKLDKNTTVFVTAGKKAAQFVARTKRNLAAEFSYKDTPDFAEARAISKFVQQMFLKGEVDAVDILFPRFINTLTQQPTDGSVSADWQNFRRDGRGEFAGAGASRQQHDGRF